MIMMAQTVGNNSYVTDYGEMFMSAYHLFLHIY